MSSSKLFSKADNLERIDVCTLITRVDHIVQCSTIMCVCNFGINNPILMIFESPDLKSGFDSPHCCFT